MESSSPMDPSIRALLGALGVMQPLSDKEYLSLIADYREPEEVITPVVAANRAKGEAGRAARLDAMPSRDELLVWFATHSIKETMKFYGITLRCVYEWKKALGIVRVYHT